MSTKYEIGENVPSNILCKRLNVLSDAVTKGRKGINREFYMSIPAQCDHDADLILSAAASRIKQLEEKNKAITISIATHLYNSGYMAGHEETVEGVFTPVFSESMETENADAVEELLDEL